MPQLKNNLNCQPPVSSSNNLTFRDVNKDLLILIPVAVLGLVGLIAASHTLHLAIYFGGTFFSVLLLPLVACIAAINVIVQKNAINSLLSLMSVFITSAAIYLIAGAGYFALVFLLIGQGAVAILFLYAVILLPLRAVQSNETTLTHNSQVFAVIVGIAGFVYLITELHASFTHFLRSNLLALKALEGTSSDALRRFVNEEANDILSFVSLYGDKTALFLLITGILLSAMIGAIVLATTAESPLVSKSITCLILMINSEEAAQAASSTP